MFAGTALSVRLFVYAGLSLSIISGPYLYMVVCILYVYNLTLDPEADALYWTKTQAGPFTTTPCLLQHPPAFHHTPCLSPYPPAFHHTSPFTTHPLSPYLFHQHSLYHNPLSPHTPSLVDIMIDTRL